MQQQEVKVPIGRMDKENSPETVGAYDYIDGHNLRTVGTEGSDANYLTNLEGTRLITSESPIGQNRGIGGARFDIIGKAYRVIYNSNGYHQIVEFDYNTLRESTVFENRTDSADQDLLNLNANSYFCDVRLLHERYLILNDGVNPIFCMNVEYLKANRGSRVFTDQDLLLSKQPPLSLTRVRYINSTGRTSNSLRGKLLQFRVQYEYEDYRTSSWSTVSKRVVPTTEPSDGQGQNVSLNNGLLIEHDIDNPDAVRKVRFAL